MNSNRKRWITAAAATLCAATAAVSAWIAAIPPITYAQALKHSNAYLLWHGLIMHAALVAVFAVSLVLTARLLLVLLLTWPPVAARWHRLLVVSDNREKP